MGDKNEMMGGRRRKEVRGLMKTGRGGWGVGGEREGSERRDKDEGNRESRK